MNRNRMAKEMLEAVRDQRMDKATAISFLKQLNARTDIAIIGMGLRVPGIEEPDEFWDLIQHGHSTIQRSTKHRMDLIRDCFPKQLLNEESTYSKGSFFDKLDEFDSTCFHLSPKEAAEMSPTHRLMLETTYHALEDAGYLGEKNQGNQTPVFIGNNFTKELMFSYSTLLLASRNYRFRFASMLANWSSGLATRLAAYFDLKGTSYTVDASCPSSTMAVIDACNAIRSGKTDMAVAGGILLDFAPIKSFNNTGWIFAHDDAIVPRSYDRNPGGAFIGEGAGVIVLKRLDKALQDGDVIHSVIRGYGRNNNGSNGAFTRSNVEDIKKVVGQAIRDAQVNADDISFLMGEGYTDRMEEGLELAGLTSGFRQFTERTQFCGLGSITGNLGYLQSAIGVFQIMTMTLALKKKMLPPVTHFVEPTDFIHLGRTPFYVNDRLRFWDKSDDAERLCALFQYGFGGNNTMLILQEAPIRSISWTAPQVVDRRELFVLSAASEQSLRTLVQSMITFLSEEPLPPLRDVCYSVLVGRKHHSEYRLAVLCSSLMELKNKLMRFLQEKAATDGIYFSKPTKKSPRGERTRRKSIDGLSLMDIARSYCQGSNYNFMELYRNTSCQQVTLPIYSFDRTSCWVNKEKMSFIDTVRFLFGKEEVGGY